ncbi:MAG: crotonase/enoyl-CoA hydratase family protein [Acidimicrobiales bacterium]
MEYSTILLDVSDGIATLTLNRPDRLNAFTVEMMREMISAFDRIDADDDVRVVIVTGAGRAFCAGADLSAGTDSFDYDELAASDPEYASRPKRDGGGLLTLRIFRCLKPVIAAINGHAVGIGATMTLPMDIRLASDGAKLGFVFGARGIVPEACSSWFLPRLVGISQAAEWIYTSRVFPASEGLEHGLLRSVHPGDELLAAATSLAREIADTSAPVSVALSRMMLWRMLGASHPMEAHRIDSRAVRYTGAQPDAREGIAAFFEKRPPQWTMSVADDLPDFVPWWDEPVFE